MARPKSWKRTEHIIISNDNKRKLDSLKVDLGIKTYDEAITCLIMDSKQFKGKRKILESNDFGF